MASRIQRNISLGRDAAARSNERQKDKILVLALTCLGIAAVLVVRNGVNPTITAKSPMFQSMVMEREDGSGATAPNSLPGHAEEGSSFEGDMKITADQYKALYGKNGLGVMANNLMKAICKNGNRMFFCPNNVASAWNRWPQGRVPYVLNKNLPVSTRKVVADAIEDFNRFTVVRWVPRVGTEVPYVSFESTERGCFAWLGRQLSVEAQPVNLGFGCGFKGIAIHEMLHTVGFAHEQSRNDRDEYITIKWANIAERYQSNFEKMNANVENNQGFGYDYSSVMHYSSRAFSQNGETTIVTKNSADQNKIGQRLGFSSQDIKEVNKAYQLLAGSTLFRVVAVSGDGAKDVYLHATAEIDAESPTRLTELRSQLLGNDEATAQVFLADLDVRLDGSWTPLKVRGGLYVTVQDGSHQSGARLEQKVFVEGDNQLFKFVPHTDHNDLYSIVVKHTRKVLEHSPIIRGVVQNDWAGRQSQLWKVVQVEKPDVYEA